MHPRYVAFHFCDIALVKWSFLKAFPLARILQNSLPEVTSTPVCVTRFFSQRKELALTSLHSRSMSLLSPHRNKATVRDSFTGSVMTLLVIGCNKKKNNKTRIEQNRTSLIPIFTS